MNWKFSNDRPIYAQIVEEIQRRIISGAYVLGSPLQSVRVLAIEAGVNPNTMQKALSELEEQGLLHTQRTSGRTVTTDETLIMRLKERIASGYIESFFTGMDSLGIDRDNAAKMITNYAAKPPSKTAATQGAVAQSAAVQGTPAAAAQATTGQSAATQPTQSAQPTQPTQSAQPAQATQQTQTAKQNSKNENNPTTKEVD